MSGLLNTLTKSLPPSLKQVVKRGCYYGNQRLCPVCGKTARKFLSAGVEPRPNARCPNCNSYERHRLLWRFLQEKTNFFAMSGKRMLDIAPVTWLAPRFRSVIGSGYLTADLFNPADVRMDITDIQFPDESFDIVYCSHVLEHVPDDRRAMGEFHRVLRSDGWAIFMVPITVEKTFEDPSVTDPAQRLRLFGQDDHVRRYGPDFADRLREAGFAVTITTAADFLSQAEIERIAVGHPMTGEVFYCTKGAIVASQTVL
jgi:SAM-dependent methyltransferase